MATSMLRLALLPQNGDGNVTVAEGKARDLLTRSDYGLVAGWLKAFRMD